MYYSITSGPIGINTQDMYYLKHSRIEPLLAESHMAIGWHDSLQAPSSSTNNGSSSEESVSVTSGGKIIIGDGQSGFTDSMSETNHHSPRPEEVNGGGNKRERQEEVTFTEVAPLVTVEEDINYKISISQAPTEDIVATLPSVPQIPPRYNSPPSPYHGPEHLQGTPKHMRDETEPEKREDEAAGAETSPSQFDNPIIHFGSTYTRNAEFEPPLIVASQMPPQMATINILPNGLMSSPSVVEHPVVAHEKIIQNAADYYMMTKAMYPFAAELREQLDKSYNEQVLKDAASIDARNAEQAQAAQASLAGRRERARGLENVPGSINVPVPVSDGCREDVQDKLPTIQEDQDDTAAVFSALQRSPMRVKAA